MKVEQLKKDENIVSKGEIALCFQMSSAEEASESVFLSKMVKVTLGDDPLPSISSTNFFKQHLLNVFPQL